MVVVGHLHVLYTTAGQCLTHRACEYDLHTYARRYDNAVIIPEACGSPGGSDPPTLQVTEPALL